MGGIELLIQKSVFICQYLVCIEANWHQQEWEEVPWIAAPRGIQAFVEQRRDRQHMVFWEV